MLLSIQNNLVTTQTINSRVTTNGTAGGTAIPVRNLNGFGAQYAVQLGMTGEEQSEIVIIDSPTDTFLPIYSGGTLRYPHPLDTPVYQINYSQVIFKRSTTGTAGTASAIATVSITPDSLFTEYNDTSGASTYAYKVQYYNPVSGALSTESDWFIPGGPSWYSLQRLRGRIKSKLNNAGFIKSDSDIDDWINEWIEEMTNKALKVNEAYSTGTASYAYGTAGFGTVTEPLFKYASKIELTSDNVTYQRSTEIPLNRYSTNDPFSSLTPRHAWVGDNVFQIMPNGNAGTAYMTLGKLQTQLVDDADELPTYLRGYTRGCTEYCLYVAKNLDEKDQAADKHFQKHLAAETDFIREITPRDQTGPKYIDLVEGIGSEDGILASEYVI